MKKIAILSSVSLMLLMFASVALAQSAAPKPAPELKQWDIWIGDWALSGTAKDSATGPEYKLDWHMHGRWILGGFFAQIDHTTKSNGNEAHYLEILSYDPIKKIHTTSAFGDDGTFEAVAATFNKETSAEDSTITSTDGKSTACHNTWVFSSDRMSVSGTHECNDGSWFKVKGTKAKLAANK
jgi:hypothetical protein